MWICAAIPVAISGSQRPTLEELAQSPEDVQLQSAKSDPPAQEGGDTMPGRQQRAASDRTGLLCNSRTTSKVLRPSLPVVLEETQDSGNRQEESLLPQTQDQSTEDGQPSHSMKVGRALPALSSGYQDLDIEQHLRALSEGLQGSSLEGSVDAAGFLSSLLSSLKSSTGLSIPSAAQQQGAGNEETAADFTEAVPLPRSRSSTLHRTTTADLMAGRRASEGPPETMPPSHEPPAIPAGSLNESQQVSNFI